MASSRKSYQFYFEPFFVNVLVHSGLTGELILRYEQYLTFLNTQQKRKESFGVFFRPIESAREGAVAALHIFTAPLLLSIAAIACVTAAIAHLLLAPLQAVAGDEEQALSDIIMSGQFALASLACMLGAVVSPVLNTIDAVGGAINTCLPEYVYSS